MLSKILNSITIISLITLPTILYIYSVEIKLIKTLTDIDSKISNVEIKLTEIDSKISNLNAQLAEDRNLIKKLESKIATLLPSFTKRETDTVLASLYLISATVGIKKPAKSLITNAKSNIEDFFVLDG